MPIIESSCTPSGRSLELVVIEVDRHSLQKCRWRRTAEDGTDFAFSLAEPLDDGDYVYETEAKRYQISQLPEPVLAIPLPSSPADAARIGWVIGNLHQQVEMRDDLILVGEDPAVRRVIESLNLACESGVEVFRPPPHSASNHHTHLAGIEYDHQHYFFGHSPSSQI